MIYTVQNDLLTLSVDSMGAELRSLKTADGTEYLWQGSPDYWMGRAPILFPIIGGLPGGEYTLKGKTYQMGSHGFAKRSDFSLAEQTGDSITLKLSASDETKKQYPFDFDFLVTFKICGTTVTQTFTVVNKNGETMPFSVGGHPAFNCPLCPGEAFTDYRLQFEKPETISGRIKREGLLCGETKVFLENEDHRALEHSLFYDDAIILKHLNSNWVELAGGKGGKSVRLTFEGFPDFGIWSCKNDGPYVCLEPWFGVDSTKGDSGAFEEKEGLVWLPAGETFEASFTIALK